MTGYNAVRKQLARMYGAHAATQIQLGKMAGQWCFTRPNDGQVMKLGRTMAQVQATVDDAIAERNG